MIKKYGWTGMALLFLVSVLSVSAEDVTFRASVSDTDITVGEAFDIQVLLDVVSGKSIKSASFTIMPTSSLTINSATSGGLWTGITISPPETQLTGGGYRYGESSSTAAAREGNGLLLVTLRATATTAGTPTLTFSNLAAARSSATAAQRTVTSVPLTITITTASSTPPPGPSPSTYSCTGGVPANARLCSGDDSGLTINIARLAVANCGDSRKCEYVCNSGYRWEAFNCVDDPATDMPTPPQSLRQQFIGRISQMQDTDFPDSWTPAFISRMARMFKEIYNR